MGRKLVPWVSSGARVHRTLLLVGAHFSDDRSRPFPDYSYFPVLEVTTWNILSFHWCNRTIAPLWSHGGIRALNAWRYWRSIVGLLVNRLSLMSIPNRVASAIAVNLHRLVADVHLGLRGRLRGHVNLRILIIARILHFFNHINRCVRGLGFINYYLLVQLFVFEPRNILPFFPRFPTAKEVAQHQQ